MSSTAPGAATDGSKAPDPNDTGRDDTDSEGAPLEEANQ